MGSLNTALMQHGYSILAGIVFLEAIGVPVPAAVALLIAGGAAAPRRTESCKLSTCWASRSPRCSAATR
jgi:membrane protein DedA with SNARE-associated domain